MPTKPHVPPLSINQAAEFLNLAPRTVRDLCAAGHLRHYRLGPKKKTIRIDRGELERYLSNSIVEDDEGMIRRRRSPAFQQIHPAILRAMGSPQPAGN